MRAFVFTDKALARYAGRFVWLSIDTENSKNAKFLEKYPIQVWPTMLIIDPKKDTVAVRYSSGATVAQLEKLLEQGERAVKGTGGAADEALARADRLASQNKPAEAADAYEAAIKVAPKNWPAFGRAAESLVLALTMAQQNDRCASRAAALHPKLTGTLSGANVAAIGLACAASMKEDAADRKTLLADLESATRAALENKKIDMAGDDRSGLYESLVGAREAAGDKEGAHKIAEQWAAFLEDAAKHAKTAEQRASFDSHRMSAYMALDQPERALPMLLESEKALPNDYNPPARLATIYRLMKRYDDALAASDRALTKVYGPRKIVVLRGRADIYAAKGDAEGARKALADAIAYAESLPEGQRSDRTIAALKKRLETMK